jgi:hypothetical protein
MTTHRSSVWWVGFLLLVPICLRAQGLDCISELRIPHYSLSSRRSTVGGTVVAKVLIGPEGRPSKIAFDPGDPNLIDEVRVYLNGATKYSPTCAGKEVEIRFTFKLEGEAEYTPPVFVYFRAPNHFIIVSTPQKPLL